MNFYLMSNFFANLFSYMKQGVYRTVCGARNKFITTNTLFAIIVVLCSMETVDAQIFTSSANGLWITNSNWMGGTAPPTAGQNWGITHVNHNLTINGNFDFRASTVVAGVRYGLEIAAGKSLTVNGNFSISNGAVVNVYGKLNITGSAMLNANLNIYPGGKVIVDGNVTILNSNYLIVGTSAAPSGTYSDLVIKNNLISQNSGDIIIERNGRVAIFKNFTSDTNGGTLMTIRSGGQIYINGNIVLTGGGDNVSNSNGQTPIGFYVNGSVSATGGGAAVDSNRGNKSTLYTNDRPFYDWVAAQDNSPLPITLLYIKLQTTDNISTTLTWATSFEENFDRFDIERSFNGVSFERVGAVIGAGNSKTMLNYSFVDQTPLQGKSYYRLKSIDNDGSFEYSQIVFIALERSKEVSFYPNPSAGGLINYSLDFNPEESDKIVVINSLGVEVETASIQFSQGEIIFAKPLTTGMYVIKYMSANFQKSERLIVK